MPLFTIAVDGVSFIHEAEDLSRAEVKAREMGKKLGATTFQVIEHKLRKVV